ncbi:MAG: class I SAM-dependent rRNA methyltransferase [Candidatus Acidiferrales bacterium]
MPEDRVVIGPRGVERLRSGHQWVYRSDVRTADAEAGAIVRLTDERGRYLGRAFYSDRSQISIRLVTHEDVPIDRAFLRGRMLAAAEFRKRTVVDAEAFRLIYGEADQIPSLVVDRYADYLVMQNLCQSVDRLKPLLVELLVELFSPHGVMERNDPKVRLLEGLEQRVSVLHGDVPEEVQARENGLVFAYDLHHGQKTGGFLDQRENHQAAANFASGEVLDCFSYHGGFALAVSRKASRVEAVDLSPAAVAAARHNLGLNDIANVTVREANSFDLLKQFDEEDRRFDMVILDPPAFAKNRESVPAAHRGYKEINLRAMKILRPGGYLVTCSCSHHISEALFLQIVAEAANDAHRTIVVVERRTQSRDHPILLTVPETHYLKCLILRVL